MDKYHLFTKQGVQEINKTSLLTTSCKSIEHTIKDVYAHVKEKYEQIFKKPQDMIRKKNKILDESFCW